MCAQSNTTSGFISAGVRQSIPYLSFRIRLECPKRGSIPEPPWLDSLRGQLFLGLRFRKVQCWANTRVIFYWVVGQRGSLAKCDRQPTIFPWEPPRYECDRCDNEEGRKQNPPPTLQNRRNARRRQVVVDVVFSLAHPRSMTGRAGPCKRQVVPSSSECPSVVPIAFVTKVADESAAESGIMSSASRA